MAETVIERLKAMKHPEWNTDVARAWPKLLAVAAAAKDVVNSISSSSTYNKKPGDLSHVRTKALEAMIEALAELEKEAKR